MISRIFKNCKNILQIDKPQEILRSNISIGFCKSVAIFCLNRNFFKIKRQIHTYIYIYIYCEAGLVLNLKTYFHRKG